MFLTEALFNRRLTEPFWFRFLRIVVAIVLTIILITYTFVQHEKTNIKYTTTKPQLISGYEFNVSVCTRYPFVLSISTTQNQETITSNCTYQLVPLQIQNIINDTWLNISSYEVNNGISFLSFVSVNLIFEKYKILFKFDVNEVKELGENRPKEFSDLVKYYVLEPNTFSIYPGQSLYLFLKPSIVYYDHYYGFGNFFGGVCQLELNPQLQQKYLLLNSSQYKFRIFTHSDIIKFEESKVYSYYDLLSNIGGFYNFIGGLFILLFGMSKHGPWGLLQKHCFPCRKSLARNFARKYISSAGIPLVEKVNKGPKKFDLKERVQILETLLRDYYLDDFYLKEVKDIKIQQEKLHEILVSSETNAE